MKLVTLNIFVLFLLSCGQSNTKSSTVVQISGMSCSQSCAPFLEKNIRKIQGVSGAKVSFENKKAEISFDSGLTNNSKIVDVIETIADGCYEVTCIHELNKNNLKKTVKPVFQKPEVNEFKIPKHDVSHSTTFQLPNLFSLLNSILR